MESIKKLEIIRKKWLNQVSQQLAPGESIREIFSDLLNNFFDVLIQVIKTDDPSFIEPLMDSWIISQTKTEWDQMKSSIPPLINNIMQITFSVFKEEWDDSEALSLINSTLPVFIYAVEYAFNKETYLRIEHVRSELENAKLNLERIEQSKSDFISVAAHELKTPLTLIEGYTAMLRETYAGEKDDNIVTLYIKGIDVGAERLRGIVDDMIDVSLIDNDLLALNFQPLWLNRLFDLVQKDLGESLDHRNLKFIIKSYPGSKELIFADSERLFQAYRNIVINAIKYTPDGGSIIVDGRTLPGFIETTISDTGIGIDLDDQLRIFEKFSQLGSVSLHSSGKFKFKGGGPGLGLPITKGIIEAHGGTIWVESKGCDEVECPGSTFHILLPLRKLPPDDKSAKLFQKLIEAVQV